MSLTVDIARNGTIFLGDQRIGRVVRSRDAAHLDRPFRAKAEDGSLTERFASREEAALALVRLLGRPC